MLEGGAPAPRAKHAASARVHARGRWRPPEAASVPPIRRALLSQAPRSGSTSTLHKCLRSLSRARAFCRKQVASRRVVTFLNKALQSPLACRVFLIKKPYSSNKALTSEKERELGAGKVVFLKRLSSIVSKAVGEGYSNPHTPIYSYLLLGSNKL